MVKAEFIKALNSKSLPYYLPQHLQVSTVLPMLALSCSDVATARCLQFVSLRCPLQHRRGITSSLFILHCAIKNHRPHVINKRWINFFIKGVVHTTDII